MNTFSFSLRTTLVIVGFALIPSAQAQPGSGGPGPGTTPIETPLDGGASLLLAAGVGLAVRKLRQRRQKP